MAKLTANGTEIRRLSYTYETTDEITGETYKVRVTYSYRSNGRRMTKTDFLRAEGNHSTGWKQGRKFSDKVRKDPDTLAEAVRINADKITNWATDSGYAVA